MKTILLQKKKNLFFLRQGKEQGLFLGERNEVCYIHEMEGTMLSFLKERSEINNIYKKEGVNFFPFLK